MAYISKRDTNFIGRRVRILAGMSEFMGKTGYVRDYEPQGRGRPTLFRVHLDEPVNVPNVGIVTSDLWERAGLKTPRD
jgi:hypothetical protein